MTSHVQRALHCGRRHRAKQEHRALDREIVASARLVHRKAYPDFHRVPLIGDVFIDGVRVPADSVTLEVAVQSRQPTPSHLLELLEQEPHSWGGGPQ